MPCGKCNRYEKIPEPAPVTMAVLPAIERAIFWLETLGRRLEADKPLRGFQTSYRGAFGGYKSFHMGVGVQARSGFIFWAWSGRTCRGHRRKVCRGRRCAGLQIIRPSGDLGLDVDFDFSINDRYAVLSSVDDQ